MPTRRRVVTHREVEEEGDSSSSSSLGSIDDHNKNETGTTSNVAVHTKAQKKYEGDPFNCAEWEPSLLGEMRTNEQKRARRTSVIESKRRGRLQPSEKNKAVKRSRRRLMEILDGDNVVVRSTTDYEFFKNFESDHTVSVPTSILQSLSNEQRHRFRLLRIDCTSVAQMTPAQFKVFAPPSKATVEHDRMLKEVNEAIGLVDGGVPDEQRTVVRSPSPTLSPRSPDRRSSPRWRNRKLKSPRTPPQTIQTKLERKPPIVPSPRRQQPCKQKTVSSTMQNQRMCMKNELRTGWSRSFTTCRCGSCEQRRGVIHADAVSRAKRAGWDAWQSARRAAQSNGSAAEDALLSLTYTELETDDAPYMAYVHLPEKVDQLVVPANDALTVLSGCALRDDFFERNEEKKRLAEERLDMIKATTARLGALVGDKGVGGRGDETFAASMTLEHVGTPQLEVGALNTTDDYYIVDTRPMDEKHIGYEPTNAVANTCNLVASMTPGMRAECERNYHRFSEAQHYAASQKGVDDVQGGTAADPQGGYFVPQVSPRRVRGANINAVPSVVVLSNVGDMPRAAPPSNAKLTGLSIQKPPAGGTTATSVLQRVAASHQHLHTTVELHHNKESQETSALPISPLRYRSADLSKSLGRPASRTSTTAAASSVQQQGSTSPIVSGCTSSRHHGTSNRRISIRDKLMKRIADAEQREAKAQLAEELQKAELPSTLRTTTLAPSYDMAVDTISRKKRDIVSATVKCNRRQKLWNSVWGAKPREYGMFRYAKPLDRGKQLEAWSEECVPATL